MGDPVHWGKEDGDGPPDEGRSRGTSLSPRAREARGEDEGASTVSGVRLGHEDGRPGVRGEVVRRAGFQKPLPKVVEGRVFGSGSREIRCHSPDTTGTGSVHPES